MAGSASRTTTTRASITTATTTTTATVETLKPFIPIRRRLSVGNLNHAKAEKTRKRKKDNETYLQAENRWAIIKGTKLKENFTSVVRSVNKKHGTNVSARTLHRHFNLGTSIVLPKKGGGKKPRLTAHVEAVLENSLKTFINISNASIKVKPDKKDLIASITKCLKKVGVDFKRFDHYYDRILNIISDEVTVAGRNSIME